MIHQIAARRHSRPACHLLHICDIITAYIYDTNFTARLRRWPLDTITAIQRKDRPHADEHKMKSSAYDFPNGYFFASQEPFSLFHTFECGQCFRWNAVSENEYIGIANGRPLYARQEENGIFFSCTKEEFEKEWFTYFDLQRSYSPLESIFTQNEFMTRAVEYGRGLRILKQDPWETLVSFLISQCNNIPRIKKIIETLCRLLGEPVSFAGHTLYTFPSSSILAQCNADDLAPLKAGYRTAYLLDAAQKVCAEGFDFAMLGSLSTEEARDRILSFHGVGRKVADCFLLFGAGKMDAFPIDTWMKKVYAQYALPLQNGVFGDYAGIAQQYIFHYAHQNKLSFSTPAAEDCSQK